MGGGDAVAGIKTPTLHLLPHFPWKGGFYGQEGLNLLA